MSQLRASVGICSAPYCADPVTVKRYQLNVLFVCSGNSGRSIMAESILNAVGGQLFNAYSAGSHPTRRINPMTIKELRRRGYPTEGLASKSWTQFAGPEAPELDYVVTVCSKVAWQIQPDWPGKPQILTWSFPSPGETVGSDDQIRAAFSDVCEQIEAAVKNFVHAMPHNSRHAPTPPFNNRRE